MASITLKSISAPPFNLRIQLVKLLVENGIGGLKVSKEIVDEMVDGNDVKIEVKDKKLENFKKELKKLQIEYTLG